MDEIAEKIEEKVIMQIGYTKYQPKNAEFFDFVDAVRNKRQPMVTIQDARKSVDLINGIYKSGKENKKIAIATRESLKNSGFIG